MGRRSVGPNRYLGRAAIIARQPRGANAGSITGQPEAGLSASRGPLPQPSRFGGNDRNRDILPHPQPAETPARCRLADCCTPVARDQISHANDDTQPQRKATWMAELALAMASTIGQIARLCSSQQPLFQRSQLPPFQGDSLELIRSRRSTRQPATWQTVAPVSQSAKNIHSDCASAQATKDTALRLQRLVQESPSIPSPRSECLGSPLIAMVTNGFLTLFG